MKIFDISKQLNAAFQTFVLDKAGSDCRTKKHMTIEITDFNKKLFLYRYVKDGDRYVLIDEDNLNKFVGKVLSIRSPLFCAGEKVCSKCAGELYYKLGFHNIGLMSARVGSTIMNASLKKFHDTSIKYGDIEIEMFID